MASDERGFQVVMDGEVSFSAPYISRDAAEERADELDATYTEDDFSVEAWPNERQSDDEAALYGGDADA